MTAYNASASSTPLVLVGETSYQGDKTRERESTVPFELRASAPQDDHKGTRQRAVNRDGDAEENRIQVTLCNPMHISQSRSPLIPRTIY